jgi:hypothetical protein
MVNPFEQTAVAGKKRGYAKPRWTDRFSATVDKGRDIGSNMLPGAYGVAMKGLEALTEGVAMANENERWFKQNAPNAQRYAGVPINVRESVQTDRDKNFFNKYMNLAAMAQDSDKKQWYLNQADTARRNLQITKRINYGLGQMDLDETPFEGYESYDQGFEGFGPQDLGPRFDIDRFSEAMSEYLPGGEEMTEDITETIEEAPLVTGDRTDDWWYTPPFDEDVTMTDLPIEEDITETITEDDFVLKKSKFDLGNLGVGNEYSPSVDLNIMNIQDSELRKKATEAALMFHQAYIEGEDGKYYGQMEDFWQAYLDAVEAGA